MRRNVLHAAAVGAALFIAAGLLPLVFSLGRPASVLINSASAESAQSDRKVKYYRNPMGLPDTSRVPKQDSMGMDYIPVYEDEETDGKSIKVSPGKIQRTGVETTTIGKHSLTRTIKAPGVIQFDERRVAVVAPRFDGYVVSVANVTTGSQVKKGDELAIVFGQEILNQAARLLVEQNTGWRNDDGVAPPGQPERIGGAVGAVRRLKNLGVPDDFIEQVKREKRVPDAFTVRAPIDGVVLERNVFDGQGFKAGDVAFRIEDHSVVWLLADIAEADLGAVKVGQPVKVMARALPGRSFSGTVGLIYPDLMKETRTARIRVELQNSEHVLHPNMYGDVEIASGDHDEALAVPLSAVIDTGNRQVVLVDLGDGRYEPREIKIGYKGDGFFELLSGVVEGDKVVVNGNFLIDSESNLQSALKGFSVPSGTETTP